MAIRLHGERNRTATLVSNEFIDIYMPSANGEFVKIYLYLLRCINSGAEDFSICSLADRFNHTENDICRALKYWESQNLLVLETGDDGKVSGIFLRDPSVYGSEAGTAAAPSASLSPSSFAEDRTETAAVFEEKKPAAESPAGAKVPPKSLTRERIETLSCQEDIQQLFYIIEQYLGKTLGSSHIETILYLYDKLHFSAELIEYLVEYCVSRGSRSIRYIETVALAWHAEHITTVEQAQEVTNQYSKYIFSVLKCFGIKGRNPVSSEITYIKKWSSEYGFTIDIITEACERTMAQIHQPSFEYTDKILCNWHKQGVQRHSDIARLDERRPKSRKAASTAPAANNKFNNFEQRSYDFDELERRLLNI